MEVTLAEDSVPLIQNFPMNKIVSCLHPPPILTLFANNLNADVFFSSPMIRVWIQVYNFSYIFVSL